MGVSHFSAVSGVFGTLTVPSRATDLALTAQESADTTYLAITLTAAKFVSFTSAPVGKVVIVTNLTAATHAVTVKVAGQTGIAVAATKSAILVSNGTDFVRVTADA